jgi:hypothetical protein
MNTRRWLLLAFGFAGAGFIVLVLLAAFFFSRPLFFRLLSAIGMLLTVVSVAAMLISARRAKTVSIRAQLVSMAISVLSVSVFAGILGARVGWILGPVALLAGGVAGIVWCFTARVSLEGNVVRRQGGVAYLALWAALFASQQLLAAALGRPPAVGMGLLLFGTGLVLGQSATLVLRAFALRSAAP